MLAIVSPAKKLDFENRTCEIKNWLDILKSDL